jgi:23S rRNA pseudoU1915 N3-methylase RlmH
VKLTIAWIGKTKNPGIQSLSDEYLKRLLQFSEAEGLSLKDEAALLKLAGREGLA